MNNELPILACTHDGIFHPDEVMSCALLRLASGTSNVSIMRSRAPRDFERADYVIDVGGKYDGIKWFDHHQPISTGQRPDGTGFSSFGLLWKSLGITMVRQLLMPYKLDDSMIMEVVQSMENFVKGIDLQDQAQLNVLGRWSVDKKIHVELATLQSIISGMNCIPLIDVSDTRSNNTQFEEALRFAETFLARLVYRKASKVMAYKYVSTRIKPDCNILFLEEYCEWYDVVSEVKHILYVIYPSSNGKAYAIQAVKAETGSNTVKNLRVPFPAEWAGYTDAELVKLSGIPGAMFCHRDRFIASAATLEAAVALAEKSIKLHKPSSTKK